MTNRHEPSIPEKWRVCQATFSRRRKARPGAAEKFIRVFDVNLDDRFQDFMDVGSLLDFVEDLPFGTHFLTGLPAPEVAHDTEWLPAIIHEPMEL